MTAKRQPHWSYTGLKRRKAVLVRDCYTCQIGGEGCTVVATTVDHIHPKAWGGTEDPSNLRAACWNCNQRKGTRVAVAQRSATPGGTLVFRGAPRSTAPVAKLPLRTRWGVVRGDYTRKATDDGDSAA